MMLTDEQIGVIAIEHGMGGYFRKSMSASDLVSFARAVERALQPQWSDQPPTAPEWYWWRVSRKLNSPILMNVQQDMYSQFRIGGGAGTTVNSQGGQWAGPLTPPE